MWTPPVYRRAHFRFVVCENCDFICVETMETFKVFVLIIWLQTGVLSAPRHPRLSVAENMPTYYYNHVDGNPDVYSFSYDVSDPDTGNTQFRAEERYPNGTVAGNYGYVDAYGAPQRYRYVADEYGYRVFHDVPSTPVYPAVNTGNEPVESSVTWTRPKKPNKKKNNNIMNIPDIQRGNDFPLYSRNPSYYVAY